MIIHHPVERSERENMIKVALIGCGSISMAHISAFEKTSGAKIVAVCDISEEKVNVAIQKTGAQGFSDYKQMITETNPDLAVITLPHALHCEAVCFCAEHGTDVFVEKPMGISSEDCEKMIECCKKNRVMLWVGNLQRYMTANIIAKQLVDSGEYGKLISITEVRNGEYFTERRPKWFSQKALSGGGIAMNLGAHALDKMKYFTNGAGVKDICGSIHLPEGSECEDGLSALVTMDNGVVGTLNIIGYTSACKYETVLYLTNGEIRMQLEDNDYIEHCKRGEDFVRTPCGNVSAMEVQIAELVDRLNNGNRTPVVDGEYGKDIVHAIKRLYSEE